MAPTFGREIMVRVTWLSMSAGPLGEERGLGGTSSAISFILGENRRVFRGQGRS